MQKPICFSEIMLTNTCDNLLYVINIVTKLSIVYSITDYDPGRSFTTLRDKVWSYILRLRPVQLRIDNR